MTFTKADIAQEVHNNVGRSKKESAQIVETLLELMKKSLEEGEDVLISGFGKFSIQERRERKGRNPLTGDPMMLPAKKVVTFRCSGKLRERINGTR